MARLRLYKGFTFNQINQQIFYPAAINPKLNSAGTAFTFSKMEAIVPYLGSIGSFKLVIKGSFKQKLFGVDPIDGRIDSIKLVGPGGAYFIIDNIGSKIDPYDLWLAAINIPLNPSALTDLIFKGGLQISLSPADDFFNGTNGDDIISGKGGADTIFGNMGDDKLKGGGGGGLPLWRPG